MVANDESDGRQVGNCCAVDLIILKLTSIKSLINLVIIWWTGGYELVLTESVNFGANYLFEKVNFGRRADNQGDSGIRNLEKCCLT